MLESVGMPSESGSNAALARELLSAGGVASLGTLEPDGGPFTSYVITAPAADGMPLTLISRLARHTQNLVRDPRASLLYVREPAAGAESMTAARLSLTGRCVKDDNPGALELYLSHHPDAARYAGFADFSLYRFEIASGHLVAGFGRIVDFSRDELLAGDAGGG